MAARENRTLTGKEMAAVIGAAIFLVAALVIAGGIVFGGWLSPAEGPNQGSENVASTTQSQAGTSASNANSGASSNVESAANNAQSSSQETTASGGGQPTTESGSSSAPAASSDSSSPSSSPSASDSNPAENTSHQIKVTVTIDSSRAHAYNKAWPESMGSSSLTLEEGASVYDALCQMGVTIVGDKTYVRSINGLAEFACGSKSGWVYQVNGVSPNKSCGYYTLQDGESITWVYTCDYEADGF